MHHSHVSTTNLVQAPCWPCPAGEFAGESSDAGKKDWCNQGGCQRTQIWGIQLSFRGEEPAPEPCRVPGTCLEWGGGEPRTGSHTNGAFSWPITPFLPMVHGGPQEAPRFLSPPLRSCTLASREDGSGTRRHSSPRMVSIHKRHMVMNSK